MHASSTSTWNILIITPPSNNQISQILLQFGRVLIFLFSSLGLSTEDSRQPFFVRSFNPQQNTPPRPLHSYQDSRSLEKRPPPHTPSEPVLIARNLPVFSQPDSGRYIWLYHLKDRFQITLRLSAYNQEPWRPTS